MFWYKKISLAKGKKKKRYVLLKRVFCLKNIRSILEQNENYFLVYMKKKKPNLFCNKKSRFVESI